MTLERLNQLQSEMSDETLISLVENEISKLCKTGGKSFKMCVPVMPEDTDMLLSELVKRYKKTLEK
jgi:hypothetical protein